MYTEPHACHVYTEPHAHCSRALSLDFDATSKLVVVERGLDLRFTFAPSAGAQGRFLAMMVEDRAQTSMNYVEFLCHIHRQIQSKFT